MVKSVPNRTGRALVSALIFIGPGDLLVQLYTRESEVVTLAGALMGLMAIAAFPQTYSKYTPVY